MATFRGYFNFTALNGSLCTFGGGGIIEKEKFEKSCAL
jgi:hypothetical protein